MKNRSILREMVSADFKVRYQSSALGYLWSLLRPLFLFIILYVVFTYIFSVGKGVPHWPVLLLLGIVFWSFFQEATVIGMTSVVARGDLIRKISVPKYLTVLTSSMSALINLSINLVMVFIFALLNGVQPSLSWLLIPFIVVELFIFATSIAFFFSALYVKFRDITYIWEVGLQAAFYITPILYPLQKVPEQYRRFFFLNPMAQIIQDGRELLVPNSSITGWQIAGPEILVTSSLVVVLAVFISRAYFKGQSKWFAENI